MFKTKRPEASRAWRPAPEEANPQPIASSPPAPPTAADPFTRHLAVCGCRWAGTTRRTQTASPRPLTRCPTTTTRTHRRHPRCPATRQPPALGLRLPTAGRSRPPPPARRWPRSRPRRQPSRRRRQWPRLTPGPGGAPKTKMAAAPPRPRIAFWRAGPSPWAPAWATAQLPDRGAPPPGVAEVAVAPAAALGCRAPLLRHW
mmetsp:Transcript_125708/g.350203  ORF Transcript_125708/g.350203 Transcript_125708/m.350203 type:complete len:201 (+) Transcript_125708:24-626(+)